jgi:hypothetical protein
VEGAGQWPAPSQLAASTAWPPAQEAARQVVVPEGNAQALGLDPSQTPPHAEPSEAQGALAPWGAPVTVVQVPAAPGTSQAWHCPSQAWSQQTPSTQWVPWHCPSAAQGCPVGLRGAHTPPAQ